MGNLYILISENEIQSYNNEILTRSVGDKIVKVISNPTEEDLKEFGYMEFVPNEEIPEYDPETQMVETKYEIRDGKIHQIFEIIDINSPELEDKLFSDHIDVKNTPVDVENI